VIHYKARGNIKVFAGPNIQRDVTHSLVILIISFVTWSIW